MPNKNSVHFTDKVIVPENGTVTLIYKEIHSGPRLSTGGCYFTDLSQPGSLMPLVSSSDDHVTIQAPVGHEIEWHCNW